MRIPYDAGLIARRAFLRHAFVTLAVAAWGRTAAFAGVAPSNFKRIYGRRADRDDFRHFLENVFHLYPEDPFHRLIIRLTAQYQTDGEIYRHLRERLPEITPRLSALTYALPALRKQKTEMAGETVSLLGDQRHAGRLRRDRHDRTLRERLRRARRRARSALGRERRGPDLLRRGHHRARSGPEGRVRTLDMTGYPEFDRGRDPRRRASSW